MKETKEEKQDKQTLERLKRFTDKDLLAEILHDCDYTPESELRELVDIAKHGTSASIRLRAISILRKLIEDTIERGNPIPKSVEAASVDGLLDPTHIAESLKGQRDVEKEASEESPEEDPQYSGTHREPASGAGDFGGVLRRR